jgi:hypothetical protein
MQRLLAWSSRMKIIPPNLPAPKSIGGQTVGRTLVHRRIEITQEREIFSVLVRGRGGAIAGRQAGESAGPKPSFPELPPPTTQEQDRNRS